MTRQTAFTLVLTAAIAALACEHRSIPQPLLPPDVPVPILEQAARMPEVEPASETPADPAHDHPIVCPWNLSGQYRLSTDARYIYRVEDDGTTARLTPAGPSSGAQERRLELTRTPEGFLGRLTQVGAFDGGPSCQIEFEARILACDEATRFTLSLIDDVEVDGRCGVVHRGEYREVVLVRHFQ
ncbi:MAG: hypothetical protein LBM75_08890 [Myxococcales bacterium]|jgi:hypothetical protein|nr:hypothetical protein [Myxococcales bacterium]